MDEEYNRVVAEVNLDAITHNIKHIKEVLGSDTELMAVVKADGYGHGVKGIYSTLIENKVDRLAVAIIEEGKYLRRKGVKLPILILGYSPQILSDDLVKFDLIPTIFSYDMAKAMSDSAIKQGKVVKIHIKLDTGMGRIGFLCNEDSINNIKKIFKLPNIEIEGIFTHFAKADEIDKTFTLEQLRVFNEFVTKLENVGVYIPIKHTSNSAGIVDLKEARNNLVRAGIIIYGLYPSDMVNKENIKLIPAMMLKTHVIFVKEVEKGTPISYGGTYVTPRSMKIATIPVGYADGYSRLLSSKGGVLINGEYAPIVGRICMDQFMVDVSEIDQVKVGDEVVLFGEQGEKCITAENIANIIGTINYEVICMIGKRVPRIYMKDKKPVNVLCYFE